MTGRDIVIDIAAEILDVVHEHKPEDRLVALLSVMAGTIADNSTNDVQAILTANQFAAHLKRTVDGILEQRNRQLS